MNEPLSLTDILEVAYTHLDDDAVDLWATVLRPSLRLVPTDDPDPPVLLGGPGWLTPEQSWPMWDGLPIDFLARIDCDAVASALPNSPLPSSGTLTLWVHVELGDSREGSPLVGTFDTRTQDGWRVRHSTGVGTEAVPHPGPTSERWPPRDAGVGFAFVVEWTWPSRSLYPHVFAALDGWQDGEWAIFDLESDLTELAAAHDVYEYRYHRIGGWSELGDPTVPVALIEAGYVADGRVQFDAPGAGLVAAGAWATHRLMVQLASDPALGWSWSLDGKLAFVGRDGAYPADTWLHASRQ